MRYKVLLCLFSLLILSCKKEIQTKESLLDHLPPDPTLVVKVNNLPNFKSELKNNAFLSQVKTLAPYRSLVDKLNLLGHVSTEQTSLLALYEVGKDNYDLVMVVPDGPELFQVEEVTDKTVEILKYQNMDITKYTMGKQEMFLLESGTVKILGSSLLLIENMVRAKTSNPVDPTLKKLYQTSSRDKSASFFLNLDHYPSLLHPKADEGSPKKPFSQWISLDFSANSDAVSFHGIAMAPDTTNNFIKLFKGTAPLTNKTAQYAPLNTQAMVSYTFDDYGIYARNLNAYLDRIRPVDSLFGTIEEVGLIYLNDQKAVLLNSYGTESLYTYLEGSKTSSQAYQGSEIMGLADKDFLKEAFFPLIGDFESNFCAVLENSFIFAPDREGLQTIISNHKNSSTFDHSQVYLTAKAALANESSVLFISNGPGVDFFAERELKEAFSQAVEKMELDPFTFAAQLVGDAGFAHFNILISKIGAVKEQNTVSPLFTLELETDLATDPQFVKNHRTGLQEIVVQDQANVLYLISTQGKVLWTKKLEGRIQGPIQQVDIYKNGRLQLAFCTNDQFMIVDRNGEDVPPFKIDFKGGNLGPLAVFDYEGKKEYRFVMTQGKKVFMYDNQAKPVRGFTFTEAPSTILGAPQHFRVDNKDFLVFRLEDKTLKILHRVGSDRIKVAEKIDFSNNGAFLYKDKISMTNKTGVLHQIDSHGKLTATNFNLNPDHGMYATANTLVLMDDNILSIKGKKVELELGVYSRPKIFYIYDKIYVSVTDIQNQRIHLYDSQAEPIPGFPVYGSSLIDLIDMDHDKKLELVAKDRANSLIVYTMN